MSRSPPSSAVGAARLFVAAGVFARGAGIRSLSLDLDGEAHPVTAFGMPRLDVLHAVQEPHAYASGFWGVARVRAVPCELLLRAEVRSGGTAVAPLARIAPAKVVNWSGFEPERSQIQTSALPER